MFESSIHQGLVHAVIRCEECDFRADWYITALEDGLKHHKETGHELTGEVGLAVWIGKEGKRMNAEREAALFGDKLAYDRDSDDRADALMESDVNESWSEDT